MPNQVTRNNHYVPVWYQRGFLELGQSQLHYLDNSPEQKVLTDGRTVTMNALHRWGPKNCFYEYDLYSTYFGTMVNDEVEKYLFGSIDVRGAKAVRAFADGDPCAMHDSFQDFLGVLGAQGQVVSRSRIAVASPRYEADRYLRVCSHIARLHDGKHLALLYNNRAAWFDRG